MFTTNEQREIVEWKAAALYGGNVTELIINPNNPDVLYAVTDVGLFRSLDGGDVWAFISATKKMHSLALFPADGIVVLEDILYASLWISDDWSLHRSDDGGGSWERAPGSISQVAVYALAAINHQGNLYLYAGTGGGEVHAGSLESSRATDGGVRLVSPGAYTYTFDLAEEGFDLYLPLFLR